MRDQQRQRRRSDAIDAARMPDRARTMRLQFLFHLVRQSRQRRVVEVFRQFKTFVAPIGRDVGGLPRKIDIVLGVDLDLLGDLWREFAEARPDLRKIGNRHVRI